MMDQNEIWDEEEGIYQLRIVLPMEDIPLDPENAEILETGLAVILNEENNAVDVVFTNENDAVDCLRLLIGFVQNRNQEPPEGMPYNGNLN